MHVLAPIDGSDCSFRALEFAVEFTDRYDGTLDVVHITDYEDESIEQLLERARTVCRAGGSDSTPELAFDVGIYRMRYANKIGKDILELVADRDIDHVVMGHHGGNTVDRLVIGSATETVIRANRVAVSVIP
ncbi:universal stress protein [Haloarchaeobius sp. HME9146]|uniref:universal stress protein n=1 Tax=Haloarchaeobius sp. HME9146 TaxID=2978732 RepID=UPI0021C13B73|nr:universal stress protein [Haloarchaeobius sp. HME9146]MCT9098477.1 universal stress protein [Haloarchaeobius sp. HME9146]